MGHNQPEVSRLLRFHGVSPRARALTAHRAEIMRLVEDAGGRDVRVFGSVAAGRDGESSDVDLLFSMGEPLGLLELEELRVAIEDIVGHPVDPVPDGLLNPALRDRALAEAVPL